MWVIRRLFFIFLVCCRFSSEGMDYPLEDFSQLPEKMPLLETRGSYDKKDSRGEESLFFTPFSKDLWIKIILRVHDPKVMSCLSMTSRGLNSIIYGDEILRAKMELFQINHQFCKFNHSYLPILTGKERGFILPEHEERDIQMMADLKRKQAELILFLEAKKDRVIDLYEEPYFEGVKEISETTNTIIGDMVPALLDHAADQNPSVCSLCPSSKMSDDLAYLAQGAKHTLTSRLLSVKRFLKIIGKNIPIVIGGTVLAVGAFSYGAYWLHQQYPGDVFDEFMAKNTTYYYRKDAYTLTYTMENYFTAYCPPNAHFIRNIGQDSFRPCNGGSMMIDGNWTDWIDYMHAISGCAVERFSNQLAAVVNSSTRVVTGPMICLPRDNSTLCCLRARQWNYEYGYSVDILIGNATEALEAAGDVWQRNLGLYYGFVAPLSLTFIWIMLLSHFCF